MRRALRLLAIPVVLLTTIACHKTVGDSLASTTRGVVIPEVMAFGDVGMGCASGEALGGMIVAYGDYSPKALRTSVLTTESAAMCVDERVWEAELAALRAARSGDVVAWKDATAVQQRHNAVAARRYLAAFQTLEAAYGVPEPGGECPKLKRAEDQLTYLLGLSAGLLAVVNDMAADRSADVPLSIPAAVVRGARCLDDDAWWGTPKALEASISALQPDAPGAVDPWSTFEASVAKGKAAGVRLPFAFLVQTAVTVGREDLAREAIADFAKAVNTTPADPRWTMLDAYAGRLVRHESDKIWTRLTGHRTPTGELGTFPGEAQPADDLPDLGLDLDEL